MSEHLVELSQDEKNRLFNWLRYGTGALILPRVTFESVAHGGIFVRTRSLGEPRTSGNGELRTHYNTVKDVHTLCGMVRGGLRVTGDPGEVTCGRCKHSLRIRTSLSIRRGA